MRTHVIYDPQATATLNLHQCFTAMIEVPKAVLVPSFKRKGIDLHLIALRPDSHRLTSPHMLSVSGLS